MRGRLFTLVSCLLLSISSVDAVHAASLTEQRRLYDQAKAALAKGNSAPYMASRSALRDYPLEPYLAYDELTHRLKSASNEEVERFLTEHGDLPQIGWLKLRWLRLLADRDDWKTFVNYYDPKLNFTELDCLYAPVPAGPRPEGRRLRHQRTPVAGRQVAAGCLRHPVRPLAGRRPAHRGKGLETPQAGRRSAQLQPRLAPRAAPADPRQPGRADGQRGAEPRPAEPDRPLQPARPCHRRRGRSRPAPPGAAGPGKGP